jgi:hypothetical protein
MTIFDEKFLAFLLKNLPSDICKFCKWDYSCQLEAPHLSCHEGVFATADRLKKEDETSSSCESEKGPLFDRMVYRLLTNAIDEDILPGACICDFCQMDDVCENLPEDQVLFHLKDKFK